MEKEEIIVYSKEFPLMRLRCICADDIEKLRVWKNKNKKSFFYQEEISEEQQKEWFKKYLLRREDYIFMAEVLDDKVWKEFGCLGYRRLENIIDLYNVMRGEKTEMRSSMQDAMALLIQFLRGKYKEEIKCDVLADNTAIAWYKKCGFYIKEKNQNFYIMMLKIV